MTHTSQDNYAIGDLVVRSCSATGMSGSQATSKATPMQSLGFMLMRGQKMSDKVTDKT